MYEPDMTEILYEIRDANGTHRVTMDLETYAHTLNNPDIEVLREIMVIHRRPDEENVVRALIEAKSTSMVYPLVSEEDS